MAVKLASDGWSRVAIPSLPGASRLGINDRDLSGICNHPGPQGAAGGTEGEKSNQQPPGVHELKELFTNNRADLDCLWRLR
jgi:hypothetical protein|uniref:hypothetical protein n=1 Tax=Cyanobium sp. TaxID=2164130 RepID=UPI00404B962C